MADEINYYIGIDLGWKDKKTTGICILNKKEEIILQKDVFGKNSVKEITPYLKKTKVIAIDAPLTEGRGKGRMRLFEKFLSTETFRKEKINPVPPALLIKLRESADFVVLPLGEKGFVLGINLIETFTHLIKKIIKKDFLPGNFKTENEEPSLICAKIAFLHSRMETCYLGYKDGFLFLPDTSFWKPEWREKLKQEWGKRDRLRYHYLTTNIF